MGEKKKNSVFFFFLHFEGHLTTRSASSVCECQYGCHSDFCLLTLPLLGPVLASFRAPGVWPGYATPPAGPSPSPPLPLRGQPRALLKRLLAGPRSHQHLLVPILPLGCFQTSGGLRVKAKLPSWLFEPSRASSPLTTPLCESPLREEGCILRVFAGSQPYYMLGWEKQHDVGWHGNPGGGSSAAPSRWIEWGGAGTKFRSSREALDQFFSTQPTR